MFSSITIDYVNIPGDYMSNMLSPHFFTKTLPELLERLLPDGNVYLPANVSLFQVIAEKWNHHLKDKFMCRYIRDDQLMEIPLVAASRKTDFLKHIRHDSDHYTSLLSLTHDDVVRTHGVDEELRRHHPRTNNVRFISLKQR